MSWLRRILSGDLRGNFIGHKCVSEERQREG